MTVAKAISMLQKIQRDHGDVEVFFDCPACHQAFTPATIVTKAVVINAIVAGEKK